jgi:hypothetical protein
MILREVNDEVAASITSTSTVRPLECSSSTAAAAVSSERVPGDRQQARGNA